jgi:hypothetical protein
VLGIGCKRRVTIHGDRGGVRMRADQVAASLGEHCWTRYSAGVGAKGPRTYERAFVTLRPDDGLGHRWLLIAATPKHGELAYYRCFAPRPVALTELVRRWHPVASRNPSRPPRPRPGSTNTRSAAGPPGGAGP